MKLYQALAGKPFPAGCAIILLLRLSLPIWAADAPQIQHNPELHPVIKHDISPPLREIPPAPRHSGIKRVVPNRPIPIDSRSMTPVKSGEYDAVLQMAPGLTSPTLNGTILGVGNGFSGPNGSWTVNMAPPDTVMDVSANYIVQVVNSGLAIFNKTGTVLYGPVLTKTIWSGFGGGCQSNNDGDGTINYDQHADRWVIAQFSVSTSPFTECVAVSQTNDPTGSWYRYSYS